MVFVNVAPWLEPSFTSILILGCGESLMSQPLLSPSKRKTPEIVLKSPPGIKLQYEFISTGFILEKK